MLPSGLTPSQLAVPLYPGVAIGAASTAGRGGGIRFPDRIDPRTRLPPLGTVIAGGI